ncbi:MAG: 2,3-bisphosphoglycerate-independent phosphoglycerate mutase [bacterium]|nr:2,3-bisphosphoglycerate-independent phosphoglycerate mutase [bacterium]
MQKKQKAFLLILDGWGIGKKDKTDAIFNANTPYIDSLYQSVPNTTLTTFGNAVGLPEGQMGNSEVGHMNLGAGRIIWQPLALINKHFEDGTVASNETIESISKYCIDQNKPMHLIGLVSNGGVHSSMEHLIHLCQIFSQKGLKDIFIHAFTDGRDTDPHSGKAFITELESKISGTNAKIASVIGRYYAMDRDKRWERTALAYNLMVNGQGDHYNSATETLEANYKAGITDEFVKPSVICNTEGLPLAQIKEGDAVFSFNFRTDRGRQITQVLTQIDVPEQSMHKLKLNYTTMTEYDETYTGINVVFKSQHTHNTLGEILSKNNYTQLRSAETEKYPHVTFFFSGGREQAFEGETRIMEPSPKVATYDLQPEMSALPLTEKILAAIDTDAYDFICLNFANSDMVGHTGVWEAIIKAAETVDACVKKIVQKGLEHGYQFIILADHGNADEAKNLDGSPNTAHSMNPVPCFILSDKCTSIPKKGKLADVAPTILKLLNLEKPAEMDGDYLF